MNKAPFTKEFLLQLFDYSPELGILIWKNHWHYPTHCAIKDQIVGHVAPHFYGLIYRRVRISHKNYMVHHIIYFLETGLWPEIIDHIDGNGLNNHISNLRHSTSRKNQQNRKSHRRGGLIGASFRKRENKWISQISILGKKYILGRFTTELEAHERYLSEIKLRGLS